MWSPDLADARPWGGRRQRQVWSRDSRGKTENGRTGRGNILPSAKHRPGPSVRSPGPSVSEGNMVRVHICEWAGVTEELMR